MFVVVGMCGEKSLLKKEVQGDNGKFLKVAALSISLQFVILCSFLPVNSFDTS